MPVYPLTSVMKYENHDFNDVSSHTPPLPDVILRGNSLKLFCFDSASSHRASNISVPQLMTAEKDCIESRDLCDSQYISLSQNRSNGNADECKVILKVIHLNQPRCYSVWTYNKADITKLSLFRHLSMHSLISVILSQTYFLILLIIC